MIEKTFDKCYAQNVPQSTLTRVANRLLADFKEVDRCSDNSIPEEVKAVAEKIRTAEESEEYEFEHTFDSPAHRECVYDLCRNYYEYRAHAYWDEDEYGDPVYHITWYFYTSEFYTKRIGDKTIHAGTYHDIYTKGIATKGKYRYFCTHRPPTNGAIPDGYVSYDTYAIGARYIGEATYNDPLTVEELNNCGLVLDPDWEQIRKAFLE